MDKRVGQIVEEIRYAFPIRHRNVRYLEPRNGFLCLSYGSPSDSSKTEVDVVDLKKGILFQFSVGAPIFFKHTNNGLTYPSNS